MIEGHCCSILSPSNTITMAKTTSSTTSIDNKPKPIIHSKKSFFLKRPPVNVQFNNITYETMVWSMKKFKTETKKILHGVTGEFKSNELSVIMGPSGAGKTTLLNILAGFIVTGSGGDVTFNNKKRERNLKTTEFRRLTCYIMQEDTLRRNLTVIESMQFVANMKLGSNFSSEFRQLFIDEILETLGLDNCRHTQIKFMSGGQQRRLSIAHELLSNSPILFLDEPTTGLDSASCAQCVTLLKRLAKDGRTVICTIHQPSALLFDNFDSLFAMANGRCFYQGHVSNLLFYLSTFGLICPPFHNPADFLIEIAIGEYGTDVNKLSDFLDKQALISKDLDVKSLEQRAPIATIDELDQNVSYYEQNDLKKPSFFSQLYLHNYKNFILLQRNYKPVLCRILANVIIALIFGYLYRDVGRNANTVLANYVYLYGTLLFIVYTSQMPVTLSFPIDIRILTREYFNRWYGLGPYFISLLLLEIPVQIICTWSYIAISYYLTNQLMEIPKIFLFFIFSTLAALTAQSFGYLIGATSSVKIAVFLSPIIAVLFSVFGFCLRYSDIPIYFRWIFHISYYRAAFHSILFTTYGLNRSLLYCPETEDYCHFREPKKFLIEMDVTNIDLNSNAFLIILIGILIYVLTFIVVWLKLNRR